MVSSVAKDGRMQQDSSQIRQPHTGEPQKDEELTQQPNTPQQHTTQLQVAAELHDEPQQPPVFGCSDKDHDAVVASFTDLVAGYRGWSTNSIQPPLDTPPIKIHDTPIKRLIAAASLAQDKGSRKIRTNKRKVKTGCNNCE